MRVATLIFLVLFMFSNLALASNSYYVKKVMTDDKTYYDIVTTKTVTTITPQTENSIVSADLDSDIADLLKAKASAVAAIEAEYAVKIKVIQDKKKLLATPDETVDLRTPVEEVVIR